MVPVLLGDERREKREEDSTEESSVVLCKRFISMEGRTAAPWRITLAGKVVGGVVKQVVRRGVVGTLASKGWEL